jgi:hypothetical protein
MPISLYTLYRVEIIAMRAGAAPVAATRPKRVSKIDCPDVKSAPTGDGSQGNVNGPLPNCRPGCLMTEALQTPTSPWLHISYFHLRPLHDPRRARAPRFLEDPTWTSIRPCTRPRPRHLDISTTHRLQYEHARSYSGHNHTLLGRSASGEHLTGCEPCLQHCIRTSSVAWNSTTSMSIQRTSSRTCRANTSIRKSRRQSDKESKRSHRST